MLNSVNLMGRLVRDPELRRTGSGVAVTSFTIAIDRDYSGKDGDKQADFIDCTAWRNTAEFIAKYFTKGRMIVLSGRLEQRNWTDKDGNKRYALEVVAESAYFGDSKKDDGNGASAGGQGYGYNAPAPGGYSAPAGYAPAPAPAGYAPAPAPAGYAPAPAPAGYAPAPAPAGYAPAPAAAPAGNNQGYAPQGGYAAPGAPDYSLLNGDDGQLPF